MANQWIFDVTDCNRNKIRGPKSNDYDVQEVLKAARLTDTASMNA